MQGVTPSFKVIIASLAAAFLMGCNSSGNNTGNNSNTSNRSNNAAPGATSAATSNANNAKASPAPTASPAGGIIDVTSTPPGAAVILVRVDEGGSGNPERKGSTPVTIRGVAPGKYSITLEKTGFKFFQKEIEVRDHKTSKIAGNLKRG